MAKWDDGVNGVTSFDEDLYNNIVRALKNSVEDSGQTIDATNFQLSEAVANYVGSGSFYTDSGAADAYVLSPVGSFKSPEQYQDGMEIRFRAGNANTTASTVNVNSLGVIDLKKADGTTDLDAGDVSTTADSVFRYDDANSAFVLGSIPVASVGIAQVEQTIKTNTFTSTANATWTDITGMSVAITPTATSSKVLVSVSLSTGAGGNNFPRGFRILRDATVVTQGDAATGIEAAFGVEAIGANETITVSFEVQDSPSSTSALTYKVQFYNPPSSSTGIFINRPQTLGADSFNLVSTITVKEVLA